MSKKILTGLVAISLSVLAWAESNEGTGEPTIQMAITPESRVSVQLNVEELAIVGGNNINQGYSELALDAINQASGQLQAGWGKAEILVGCGQADVIIYRQQQGQWVEQLATRVAIDACVE